MSNQINMDVAAVVTALNNKYDADKGQQTYETSTEAKSAAQAAIMAAEAAQTTANAATKVADAAVDLIDVSLPLKYDKTGGTITGNAVVDGNLTVTGTITANTISGTVSDAVRATKDSNNNVIVDTYATKSEINEAKAYTDTAIANLVDSAPSTLNTLGELAEAFQENDELIDALNATVGNKANSSEVVKLSGDQTISGTKKFNSAIDGSVLGNAATANKLTTARSITLTGDVTGSVNFDGSDNVTLSTTVTDDSHNHVISNIDNLQSTLDGKVNAANGTMTFPLDDYNVDFRRAGDDGNYTVSLVTNKTLDNTKVYNTLIDKDGKFLPEFGTDLAVSDATVSLKNGDSTLSSVTIDNVANATSATKATQDASGNVITSTYATKTALNAKAPLASPALTGTPTAPTATAGTNNTQIATTAFVTTAVTNGTSSKVSGPASAVSGQIAVFDGTTGKIIKDSGFTIATSVPANAKFTDTTYTAASATPVVAGTGAVGTSAKYAREDHVHPAQTTVSGNAGSATKLATARTIDGVSFNGAAAITHFGTCSTDAATAAKTVACTGFTLVTGAEITVQFTVTNTAANPTLNVNSTGAKAIVYRNSAISAGYLAANRCYRFVYDGTNYELVGDINTDTNNKVAQTITTTNAEYALLAMADAAATATKTNGARFASAVTLNPSTNTITATTFKGALSGNAATATKATQDSAGQQINTTYIKGLSISGKTITYTKGDGTTGTLTTQDTNTDTKVTNTLATTTKAYVTGTTSATTSTGTQVFDTGVYLGTTAGYLHVTRLVFSNGAQLWVG